MPGSKPGERRSAGRPKGSPNKGVDIRNPVVAEMAALEMRARAADPQRKQARETLATAHNILMGLAARCQNAEKEPITGLPKDPAVRETFWRALHHACMYAHWLAPYESPTFKAVHLAIDQPATPGDDAKVINLKIFDHAGNIVKDEVLGE